MDMTISFTDVASYLTEEDGMDQSEKRWKSQTTPAFPLPLGVTAPKFPSRKVSMERIVPGESTHEQRDKVEPNETFPHVLRKKTPSFPLSLGSAAPKYPRRKTSMECIAEITHERSYKAEPNETFPILRKKLVSPRYPRRQAAPSRRGRDSSAPQQEAHSASFGRMQFGRL